MIFTKKNSLFWGLLLIGGGLLLLYAMVDPATTVWMPKCFIHVVTGWDCPGCGSQRAVHALLHGDFRGAFAANAFLVCLLPYLLLLAYAELRKRHHPKLYRALCNPGVIAALMFLVVVWTVFRNIAY